MSRDGSILILVAAGSIFVLISRPGALLFAEVDSVDRRLRFRPLVGLALPSDNERSLSAGLASAVAPLPLPECEDEEAPFWPSDEAAPGLGCIPRAEPDPDPEANAPPLDGALEDVAAEANAAARTSRDVPGVPDAASTGLVVVGRRKSSHDVSWSMLFTPPTPAVIEEVAF